MGCRQMHPFAVQDPSIDQPEPGLARLVTSSSPRTRATHAGNSPQPVWPGPVASLDSPQTDARVLDARARGSRCGPLTRTHVQEVWSHSPRALYSGGPIVILTASRFAHRRAAVKPLPLLRMTSSVVVSTMAYTIGKASGGTLTWSALSGSGTGNTRPLGCNYQSG